MLCGMWDLSSLTRREPVPLEMEEQSLTHWTTRKAPNLYCFKPLRFGCDLYHCIIQPILADAEMKRACNQLRRGIIWIES